jgi:serine/threonine-protein kinase
MARYRFADFELNLATRELSRAGELVDLQPKVFAVLALLVRNPDRALSKDDFLEQVWSGRFVTDYVLSRCIRELRKVLGDDAREPRFIRTVRAHGYQFVAPVAEVSETDARRQVRVAVLPFRPLDPRASDAALELGLADTLINDLSRMERLVVRPLDVVMHAGGGQADADALALGRRLDVDVLIEGRLQLARDRVRISARALRVPGGLALLSERFEEELTDLFRLQDTLSGRISRALQTRLGGGDPAAIQRGTRSVRAYRHYVDGRLNLARHSVPSVTDALASFERALDIDPDYLEPLIGVAEANDVLATIGTDPARYHENCRRAAQAVIDADPGRARAWSCLGKVAWQFDWDWARAEECLRHATKLDPGDAESLIALSDFLCYQARYDEALEAAERAGEINPFSPWIQALIAQALYMGGQTEQAITQARRALELTPDFGFSHFFLGLALMAAGRNDQAIEHIRQACDLTGRQDFTAVLGLALARAGDEQAARSVLDEMRALAEQGAPVPPVAFAVIHTGLGEEELALECFQQVLAQRSWHLLLLHADPGFQTIRARPEGLALLREAGLPL